MTREPRPEAVELAVGSRIERTEAVIVGLEDRIRQALPEAVRLIS